MNNAINVPAGTKIRLEFANIINPSSPNHNYKVTVTTRNAANAIIDGPTQSAGYLIEQIGPNAIANNAVTTPKISDNSITLTKPAESFMKRVTVFDSPAGHAVGWDPDGVDKIFSISDPAIGSRATTYVIASVMPISTNQVCQVADATGPPGAFQLLCDVAPVNTADLKYVVVNLPSHESG